jgi:hypothetical protein
MLITAGSKARDAEQLPHAMAIEQFVGERHAAVPAPGHGGSSRSSSSRVQLVRHESVHVRSKHEVVQLRATVSTDA